MEEISKAQIARLVLGYLKKEKYTSAYHYFYKQCPYFDKYRQRKLEISTRYNGMALQDILQQYTEIYSIVQPKLEATEYFENKSFHYQELPQQILYLLEQGQNNRTTSSTSPNEPDEHDPSYLSSIELNTNLDVSTTPLQTLPGNAIESNHRVNSHNKSNNFKFQTPLTRHDTETERDESSSCEGEKSTGGINEVVEVFKETLLANEELQEKLAHTINEVRAVETKESQNQTSMEVDSAIKAVINKTETDPVFENLLQEILGPVPTSVDKDRTKGGSPKVVASTSQSEVMLFQPTQPEVSSSTTVTSGQNKSDGRQLNSSQENVIVIDGTTCINSQAVVFNPNNVLVLKNQTSTALPGLAYSAGTSAASFGVAGDSNKNTFYISQQGQTQFNITEQDIMSMPVYVCDEKHEEKVMVEQGVQVPEKRLKTMMPVRKSHKNAENIADYITLYKCDANDADDSLIDLNNQDTPSGSSQQHQIDDSLPEVCTQDINLEPVICVDSRTPEQAVPNKPAPTPRSGNRSSHVRALTFKNFQTPSKDVSKPPRSSSSSPPKTYVNKHKTPLTQKPAKSLFSAGTKIKEPWDMKFRSVLLTTESTDMPTIKKTPKKEKEKNSTKSPNENIDSTNNVKTKTKSKTGKVGNKKKIGKVTKGKPSSASPDCSKKAEKINQTTPQPNKNVRSKESVVDSKDEASQSSIKLVNINKAPVYKRKCNTGIKKDNSETRKTDKTGTHILSPSKLKGSKRSLVELESKAESSKVTPDMNKMEPAVVPSPSTMRNIIPLLQTPAKDMCPKTPSVYNPADAVETPLTKVFNEHMAGVDIASIDTPNLMLTPSFAITPFMSETPTYNRPTDYSTSSSYYQPSDTEQNKSLEKLLKECQKPPEVEQPPATLDKNAKNVDQAVAEKIKALRTNVIGRKNLNLIKTNEDSKKYEVNLSESSSSDDDSSSSSDSDSDEDNSLINDTVVDKRDKSRYPLRSRQSPNVSANSESSGTLAPKSANRSKKKFKGEDMYEQQSSPLNLSGSKDSAKTETSDKIVQKIAEKEKKEINEIVHNVEFIPVLKRMTSSEGEKSKLLTDLEMKKMRVLQGIKNDSGEKSNKSTRLPPKKRKTTAPVRVLRSNTAKLKEEDLNLTSSDEEIVVRPFEVVETELLCSNSNTPVLNSPKDSNEHKSNEQIDTGLEIKKNLPKSIANSPEHDEMFKDVTIFSVTEKVIVQNKETRTPKKGTSRRKETPPKKINKLVEKDNKTIKTLPKPQPVKKVTNKPKPRETSGKNDSTKPIDLTNDPTETNTMMEQNVPEETKTDTVIPPKLPNLPLNPEKPEMKLIKGSTGEDAKILIAGLKERGINLKERETKDINVIELVQSKQTDNVKSDKNKNQEDKAAKPPDILSFDRVIHIQKEDKIGACISTINTPDEDLIYFDSKVFSDPIFIDGTNVGTNKVERDIRDDNLRLTKSYGMTVYDDVTDAEIQKVMHVSPFETIFEYYEKPVTNIIKKNKIAVLNNVVVKAGSPLNLLYKALVGDDTPSRDSIEESRNSPLENLYSSESNSCCRFVKAGQMSSETSSQRVPTQSKEILTTEKPISTEKPVSTQEDESICKKRKAECSSEIEETDVNKKVKIDELLNNMDLDDLLEQIHG